jgi:hypothetical protein
MAVRSVPAPGSDSARHAIRSPVDRAGSHFCCWAGVPCNSSGRTPNAVCMASTSATVGSPQASASSAAT